MFALLRLILNSFSGAPKLSLMRKVSSSPKTRKLFLTLRARDDELLSTLRITILLAVSLSKLYSPFPSNAIRYSLYIFFFIAIFYYASCTKQKFFIVKFLRGIFGEASKS